MEHLPKDMFFAKMDSLGLALTYGEVRLKTNYSNTMPRDVSIRSRFSVNIPLNTPIVSAAMDTVTEYAMAIEMAKLGGLGVIHKNLDPQQQAYQVSKVKHHFNALIERPITVNEQDSIDSILNMKEERGYSFHTFPVLDNEGMLAGIITETEFQFCDDLSLTAGEIMTTELITADEGTDLNQAYKMMTRKKKKNLPLIDDEGNLAGLYVFSDVKRAKSGYSKINNIDRKGRLRAAAAIGVGDSSIHRLEKLLEEDVDVVVIDTAHADSKSVYDTLKEIKRQYSIDAVVGNISSPESAKRLVDAGADGIKIGQGPGAICTTRIIAGIGMPQVTAVYECEKAIRGSGIPICADGGLEYSGDIPIAIGSGASSVMMGSMLAGTDKAPGEIVYKEGRQWKVYRGMGSLEAMKQNRESRARYSQDDSEPEKVVPEGVTGNVAFKGNISDVMHQYVGGLRAGMGYVGAKDIEELRKKADFRRISHVGQEESHPHGLRDTREAPNYQKRR